MIIKDFRKYLLVVGLLALSSPLIAQDTVTETKANSPWTPSNKAEVVRGEVNLLDRNLFKVKRIGNVGQIFLRHDPLFHETTLYVFEITHQGQTIHAEWDKSIKGWKFHVLGKGNHTVYVSKRKNNTETIPFTWFVLSN